MSAVESLDLGKLRWAVRSLSLRDALTPMVAVALSTDIQLRGAIGRLAEAFLDQGTNPNLTVRDLHDVVTMALLGSDGGVPAAIARHVLEDPDPSPGLVAVAAAAHLEPELKIRAFNRTLGELDVETRMDLVVGLLDSMPQEGASDELLHARPTTVAGCERHMQLVAAQLGRTRWVPERETFIELIEAWADVSVRGQAELPSDEPPAAVLVRGMARTWAHECRWRAAGVASFAQMLIAPDHECLARAIFEASSIADWPLLDQVIDVATWVDESLSPESAEYFLHSIAPTVGRLRSHGDDQRAEVVVGLAESCASSASGPLSELARQMLDTIWASAEAPQVGRGVPDLIAQDAVIYAVWGHTQLGAHVHDTASRTSAAEALHIAWDAGLERRKGPLSLLLLADLAIEFGDLEFARDTIAEARRIYPDHSTVIAAERKVVAHTGDDRRADELLDEIGRLWGSGRDGAGSLAQIGVLEELRGARGGRLAAMRAQALMTEEEFRPFLDRLARIQE